MLKKFIIGLLGIIVLLVAGFFCAGVLYPAVEYTTTVEVNKSRDVTWQVMRERRDWIYGFKSYEQLSGTPNETGSRARVTVVRDGRETIFDTELLDIKPPEYAVTQFTNDMNVTMSCDHRTIDGATGAKFLQTFRQMLEQPAMMLV